MVGAFKIAVVQECWKSLMLILGVSPVMIPWKTRSHFVLSILDADMGLTVEFHLSPELFTTSACKEFQSYSFLGISEVTCGPADGGAVGMEVVLVCLPKACEKRRVRIVAVHKAEAQIATSTGMK
jgi:hypothetical protein